MSVDQLRENEQPKEDRAEQKRKAADLVEALVAYQSTLELLKRSLEAYPFKNKSYQEMLGQIDQMNQKVSAAMSLFAEIRSQRDQESTGQRVREMVQELFEHSRSMLPVYGNPLPQELRAMLDREEDRLRGYDGQYWDFKQAVGRAKSGVEDAEKEFKKITEGDFESVVRMLAQTRADLLRMHDKTDPLTDAGNAGENVGPRNRQMLDDVSRWMDRLGDRISRHTNLRLTSGGNKEHWKPGFYADFTQIQTALYHLVDQQDVLRNVESAKPLLQRFRQLVSMVEEAQISDAKLLETVN